MCTLISVINNPLRKGRRQARQREIKRLRGPERERERRGREGDKNSYITSVDLKVRAPCPWAKSFISTFDMGFETS